MSYLSRGPASAGIDSKASAAGRRTHGILFAIDCTEATQVRHPARSPNSLGIDGKPSAARRRIDFVSTPGIAMRRPA